MKAFHYEMFKPTPKTAAIGFASFVLPVALVYWIMKWERVGLFGTFSKYTDFACHKLIT